VELRGHLNTSPPGEEPSVHIGKGAGWTRGRFGCCGEEEILLLVSGVE
jgi:hypothetical protein